MKRAQCINEVYEIAGMAATHGVHDQNAGAPRLPEYGRQWRTESQFFNVDTGFDYEERFPFPWADLDHPSHSVATSMAKKQARLV